MPKVVYPSNIALLGFGLVFLPIVPLLNSWDLIGKYQLHRLIANHKSDWLLINFYFAMHLTPLASFCWSWCAKLLADAERGEDGVEDGVGGDAAGDAADVVDGGADILG